MRYSDKMNNVPVTRPAVQDVKIFSLVWLRQMLKYSMRSNPKRIVTTCPHCLHTIKNEYPAFGGNYEVIHHTQFINELVGAGKDSAWKLAAINIKVTFHDPCYLGRHNKIFEAPREALNIRGALTIIEMPRNSAKSFCCRRGWRANVEGRGKRHMRSQRGALRGSQRKRAQIHWQLDVPFCMTMLSDASKADGDFVPGQGCGRVGCRTNEVREHHDRSTTTFGQRW